MMKKLIVILMMMISLGCAKDEPQPNEIRFTTRNNLPIIHTKINGIGGSFLIDTGASSSYIDSTVRARYDFDTYGEYDEVVGIGGSQTTQEVYNITVKYNDSILDVKFRTIDLSVLRSRIGVVGIIGSDYLNQNKLKVDFETFTLNVIYDEGK